MDVVNLPVGMPSSAEDDCIRIQQLPDGNFMLTGTVLSRRSESEPDESVGLIGGQPYQSYESAEAAGLAWANELGVTLLHVSRSNGTEPLPEAS